MADLAAALRQADRGDIPAMHRVRLAVRENRLTFCVITEEHYIPAIEVTGRGWVIGSSRAWWPMEKHGMSFTARKPPDSSVLFESLAE